MSPHGLVINISVPVSQSTHTKILQTTMLDTRYFFLFAFVCFFSCVKIKWKWRSSTVDILFFFRCAVEIARALLDHLKKWVCHWCSGDHFKLHYVHTCSLIKSASRQLLLWQLASELVPFLTQPLPHNYQVSNDVHTDITLWSANACTGSYCEVQMPVLAVAARQMPVQSVWAKGSSKQHCKHVWKSHL